MNEQLLIRALKIAEILGDSPCQLASEEAGKYIIARTCSAGVFAGTLVYRDGMECVLANARRLWSWAGAASLSQLAIEGVKKPIECKFAMPVNRVLLTQVIEILDVTPEARTNIQAVPIWKQ